MRQLDGPIAEHFGLKRDSFSKAPLRLVEFFQEGEPRPIEPPEFRSFIAVSYCWHNNFWTPTEGLHRDGPDMPISRPMLESVLDNRESVEETVWIDGLCINQDDKQEKIYAIGSMKPNLQECPAGGRRHGRYRALR
jgi:hypothetical protein